MMSLSTSVFHAEESCKDCDAGGGALPQRRREECLMPQAPLMELLETVIGLGSRMEIRAKGYSMDPFIREGDILAISPIPSGGLQLGDIVAFRLPAANKFAIHRVIGVTADAYLVRGDCCSEPDGLIPKKDVLGAVSRIERLGCNIRLGLGPEKAVIAFLSSKNILWRAAPFVKQGCGIIMARQANLQRL